MNMLRHCCLGPTRNMEPQMDTTWPRVQRATNGNGSPSMSHIIRLSDPISRTYPPTMKTRQPRRRSQYVKEEQQPQHPPSSSLSVPFSFCTLPVFAHSLVSSSTPPSSSASGATWPGVPMEYRARSTSSSSCWALVKCSLFALVTRMPFSTSPPPPIHFFASTLFHNCFRSGRAAPPSSLGSFFAPPPSLRAFFVSSSRRKSASRGLLTIWERAPKFARTAVALTTVRFF
mmetsp:Transcript_751/g.1092  ORF Transcript_751/g.1092 Transcript_751/m.1092 type:complete len:230 (+) Transcript_751:179-868(+)